MACNFTFASLYVLDSPESDSSRRFHRFLEGVRARGGSLNEGNSRDNRATSKWLNVPKSKHELISVDRGPSEDPDRYLGIKNCTLARGYMTGTEIDGASKNSSIDTVYAVLNGGSIRGMHLHPGRHS